MVVGVNPDTKQVSMLSIPRDLWVYIPTIGWSRINTAHRWGFSTDYAGKGPGLLADTIEMHLGIPIDHWARIDFRGFERVVDELGGVEMAVNCPVNLRYKAPNSEEEEEMYLEPGVYPMDGATALRYVRTRRGSSDFDRARRQQQFLKAMWDQSKDPGVILKIPGLYSALSDSFDTDLDVGAVLSLARVALDLEHQRIRNRNIGPRQTQDWINADGWQVLLPRYPKIQQIVDELYAPPSSGDDETAKEGARLEVLNGTYRWQLAKLGADQLRWYGLKVVETGLADNPDYGKTQLIIFDDKPKAVELLIEVLDVKPENVIYQPDSGQSADIRVILGHDYDPCE